MRFLADECCPTQVVAALRGDGHDVEHVLETRPGATDPGIAQDAIEQDRIVITEDYDYGEMAVRQRLALPGVVLLAMGSQTPMARATRLRQVIVDLGDRLRGHLVIVEPRRVRVRPLREEG